MRILLLATSFNGFTQRVFADLEGEHDVSVEFGQSPDLMREAVDLFEPDVIICPFLKQAVPEDIWRNRLTIIMHPGIVGDRGPSSIDWAIMERMSEWGMTALEADAEMDAGAVWSTHVFKLPLAPKSYVYRMLAAEAGMKGVSAVLEKLHAFRSLAEEAEPAAASRSALADIATAKRHRHDECAPLLPKPLDLLASDSRGRLRPSMKQTDRRIDWKTDTTETIVRKIHAADGFPGVLDRIFDADYFMFGAHFEDELGRTSAAPLGDIIATRHGAICRKTTDGAVWISHLKRKAATGEFFKLPAMMALPAASLEGAPESIIASPLVRTRRTFGEIRYEERNDVGYLFWEFYNGAMSTEQCKRLEAAIHVARQRPTKVLVFMGGKNFWSNGIHLNVIEAAPDPALESWRNINAIDDVVLAILTIDDRLTISAVGANAGAGGVMLGLAADRVFMREGVILNPHYKAMGLYGSEYWTYSLPKRVGREKAIEVTNSCLPVNGAMAAAIGMVDAVLKCDVNSFEMATVFAAESLARAEDYATLLARKRSERASDEARKPLSLYRHEELGEMRENFWGAQTDYHLARRNFVHKIDCGRAPLRIARHRLALGEVQFESSKPICRSAIHEAVANF